jgi:hypothetical protein
MSVVMFLFFSWVLTSARNSSPFLIPVEVIAWACVMNGMVRLKNKKIKRVKAYAKWKIASNAAYKADYWI